MARVLMPLPDRDFDLTEVVVPWRRLVDAGHDVVIATPEGATPACDPLLITGVVFGQLGAIPNNIALYRNLERWPGFLTPASYADLDAVDFDALVLAGGHAPGMRQYLESERLQQTVRGFFSAGKPVGAICHGTVVLARSQVDGKSVLSGRTATCLPAWMEWSAYAVSFWKLGRYYRTYPTYVQTEVKAALGPGGRFERGPLHNRYDRPFVVEDGTLVTARWPGDADAFSTAVLKRLDCPL